MLKGKSKGKTEKQKNKSSSGKKIGLSAVILLLIILILCFGTIITFVTDYWWFKDLGYTQVFFKKLFTELKIGIPAFVIIFALSEVYLRLLKKEYLRKLEPVPGRDSDKSISRMTHIISAVFSLVLTWMVTTTLWQQILYAMNSTDFNVADPIFNNDVSFYVFRLALLNSISSMAISVIVGFLAVTLIYYAYMISVRRPSILDRHEAYEDVEEAEVLDDDGNVQQNPWEQLFGGGHRTARKRTPSVSFDKSNFGVMFSIAKRQVVILAVLFLLAVAGALFLKQYTLLYSGTGNVTGAGFTDIHITLWAYRIEAVLAVLSAVGVLIFARKNSYKKMLILPVITICVSVAATLAGTAMQSLYVSPDELNKESKYLKSNIEFTQKAYDLDSVNEIDFPASENLTAEGILENSATLSNVRINDFSPSEQFYNQTQSIRAYYSFFDVDVDRYMIDGEYTQTFLSAREINYDNLGEDVSWLSKHLKYTHGYGITLSRVDAITATGQPKMIIDNIPPESDTQDIQVKRPEIYFGESTDDYIITNTSEQEFDYPSGTSNVYTTYEGENGIELSLLKRIFYAIKEQNIKILVSTNIDSNSKILYERNIMDRVTKLAPFLYYDADPYIVVSDSGKLYWIIDAYTTSSYYPYSKSYQLDETTSVNYIRNPIKVVVDAYNGSVDFYQVSDEPIADTIGKIYPGLIKDISEMPEDLAKHIRYPNTLFAIQANIYQRYHMDDVNVFYQNEDKWSIATEIYGQEEKQMEPNYYIMKLPGEESEEFISSIPFTPNSKKNMTGLLIARSDGDKYGELVLYRLPKDKVVYGPMQIESQIDQNTEISKEFSLWNSSGSKYTRGDMFVIPINDSILYVEPVYLESSTDTSLPEVKRVIVAYGDRIAYEPTLAEALIKLFSLDENYTPNGAPPETQEGDGQSEPDQGDSPSSDTPLSLTELAGLASEAYDNAVAAQREGDWATYGKYLEELNGYLDQMAA